MNAYRVLYCSSFEQKNLAVVYNFDEMAEYTTGDGHIAALIAAQRRPIAMEDPTRIGCPLPPNPTVGKEEDIQLQDASPQPPSYDTLYIPPRVPVASELNGNPLWQVVENDLRRDANVDDPLKGARRVGRKLIAAMYFPLLNDGVRFIWSLLQVVILFGIVVLQFWAVVVDEFESTVINMYNCSYTGLNWSINFPCYDTTHVDTAEALSIPMGVLATIIALTDCIACTSYLLHRKCCKRPQTAPEEQPLLGARVRWARLSAVANWWHKYSDIPRFKVFEALYVVIYYLAFASRNDNIPLSIITVVAGSLYGATLLLQAAIFVRVVYSTYYQRHHSISYRATGLLWAFVVHFITHLLYLVLLLVFSYIYGHYGITPASHGGGETDGVIFTVFALSLVCGCFIVPLFSHLTFFTMLYGWFKCAYTKTFVDFFNCLNNLRLNSISLQERKSIKFVLDKYHYEALITPPCTWKRSVSYIPGCVQMMVLGLLLTILFSSLSLTLVGISYAAINCCFVPLLPFLTFTLLLHIVYIAAAIVWPFYLLFDLLGRCCY